MNLLTQNKINLKLLSYLTNNCNNNKNDYLNPICLYIVYYLKFDLII